MTTFTANQGFEFNFSRPQISQSQAQSSKPSERAIQYYKDICARKGIICKNYYVMTREQLDEEIKAVNAFYPATIAQVNKIKELISELQTLGVQINHLSDVQMNALTGGREGSASKLIGSLMDVRREQNKIARPTDNQLKFMIDMILCPDIAFEAFDIKRKVDLGDGLWRLMTANEFAEEIASHMTQQEASKFIDDNRGDFFNWRKTRITPQQMEYIRTLEKRQGDLKKGVAVEWAISPTGELVQVTKPTVVGFNTDEQDGYAPLTDMQLMMFSHEEASKYIDILKSESARTNNKGTGLNDTAMYSEQEDGSQTFEDIRTTTNLKKVLDKEFADLQDLMFKLEAVAGYENPEVHEAVSSLMVDKENESDSLNQSKNVIREFMLELVDQGYIEYAGMVELCGNSETALRILIGR